MARSKHLHIALHAPSPPLSPLLLPPRSPQRSPPRSPPPPPLPPPPPPHRTPHRTVTLTLNKCECRAYAIMRKRVHALIARALKSSTQQRVCASPHHSRSPPVRSLTHPAAYVWSLRNRSNELRTVPVERHTLERAIAVATAAWRNCKTHLWEAHLQARAPLGPILLPLLLLRRLLHLLGQRLQLEDGPGPESAREQGQRALVGSGGRLIGRGAHRHEGARAAARAVRARRLGAVRARRLGAMCARKRGAIARMAARGLAAHEVGHLRVEDMNLMACWMPDFQRV